jgi:hypothetical protein
MIEQGSLREIEDFLPNGFHDARLREFFVSFSQREVKFHLEIFVGDPDASEEDGKERYRNATLLLRDVYYFVVDFPPDKTDFPIHAPRIDGGAADEASPDTASRKLPPPGTFAYWFYIQDCNGFIHFAAKTALFQWE